MILYLQCSLNQCTCNKGEVGEMAEVEVTVGLGQVLGQVQIESELDALSVESMIILHENVQLG